MAGTFTIRWGSAARFGGIGIGAIAALVVLVIALEPPAPAAVPPDVGLGRIADAPPARDEAREPAPASSWSLGWPHGRGDRTERERHPAERGKSETRRSPRPPRPDLEEREKPSPAPPAAVPAPAPPPAIAYAPAPPPTPPPAPAAQPTPAPPATPTEFGFER